MAHSLAPEWAGSGLDYVLRGSAPRVELLSPEGEEYTRQAGRRQLLGTYHSVADAEAAAERFKCAYCGDLHGGLSGCCAE